MANFSNYSESGIIQHLFRTNTFAKPLHLAVALTRIPPTDADTGTSIDEVPNSNGYARVNLGAPADALFTDISQDALGSGTISNLSAITFPQCTGGDWGWVSGVVITNSGVWGSGMNIVHGLLTPAKLVTVNDTFSFPIGNLQFKIN